MIQRPFFDPHISDRITSFSAMILKFRLSTVLQFGYNSEMQAYFFDDRVYFIDKVC